MSQISYCGQLSQNKCRKLKSTSEVLQFCCCLSSCVGEVHVSEEEADVHKIIAFYAYESSLHVRSCMITDKVATTKTGSGTRIYFKILFRSRTNFCSVRRIHCVNAPLFILNFFIYLVIYQLSSGTVSASCMFCLSSLAFFSFNTVNSRIIYLT